MNEIVMRFTAQELDIIYASLKQGPFVTVAPVIDSIERQVAEHNDGLRMEPPEEGTEDANAESGTE